MYKTMTVGMHTEKVRLERKIQNYRELCDFRIDPTKYTRGVSYDDDELIDKNLIMILNDEELHHNLTVGMENQKKYEMVVANAD
jgi:hypothetical protein